MGTEQQLSLTFVISLLYILKLTILINKYIKHINTLLSQQLF